MVMMLVPIVIIIVLGIIVVPIVFSKGNLRKAIIITYSAMVGFLLSSIIIATVDKQIDNDVRSKEYSIFSGTILSSVTYSGEIDGYIRFHSSGLFYADTYVTDIEKVNVSPLVKIFKSAKIYNTLNSDIDYNDERITLSDGSSAYYTDVVKEIRPNYGMLLLYCLGITVPSIIVVGIAFIITVFVKRAKDKEKR